MKVLRSILAFFGIWINWPEWRKLEEEQFSSDQPGFRTYGKIFAFLQFPMLALICATSYLALRSPISVAAIKGSLLLAWVMTLCVGVIYPLSKGDSHTYGDLHPDHGKLLPDYKARILIGLTYSRWLGWYVSFLMIWHQQSARPMVVYFALFVTLMAAVIVIAALLIFKIKELWKYSFFDWMNSAFWAIICVAAAVVLFFWQADPLFPRHSMLVDESKCKMDWSKRIVITLEEERRIPLYQIPRVTLSNLSVESWDRRDLEGQFSLGDRHQDLYVHVKIGCLGTKDQLIAFLKDNGETGLWNTVRLAIGNFYFRENYTGREKQMKRLRRHIQKSLDPNIAPVVSQVEVYPRG